MMSDRPYRKALSLPHVREQLIIYSGKQFDLEVVKAAIEEDVLEAHQAEIQLQKDEARLLCDSEVTRTVGIEPQENLRPEKVQN